MASSYSIPLISTETARDALDLYCEHRPHKPIVAVINSHSHVDHWFASDLRGYPRCTWRRQL